MNTSLNILGTGAIGAGMALLAKDLTWQTIVAAGLLFAIGGSILWFYETHDSAK